MFYTVLYRGPAQLLLDLFLSNLRFFFRRNLNFLFSNCLLLIYTNPIYFCVSMFYPAILLNSLIIVGFYRPLKIFMFVNETYFPSLFLFFYSVNVMDYINWLSNVQPLCSWGKPHLVVLDYPYYLLLNSTAHIFLEFLPLCLKLLVCGYFVVSFFF